MLFIALGTAALLLTSGLWARTETSLNASNKAAAEMTRQSIQPGAVMNGGDLELRGIAGDPAAGVLTADNGARLIGGFMIHGAGVMPGDSLFKDGFESGDASAWAQTQK